MPDVYVPRELRVSCLRPEERQCLSCSDYSSTSFFVFHLPLK